MSESLIRWFGGKIRLCSVVVLLGCDVLPMVIASAIFRTIGNGYKLIIGGLFMKFKNYKDKSLLNLNNVMETLLVVGNLGASIADQRFRTE